MPEQIVPLVEPTVGIPTPIEGDELRPPGCRYLLGRVGSIRLHSAPGRTAFDLWAEVVGGDEVETECEQAIWRDAELAAVCNGDSLIVTVLLDTDANHRLAVATGIAAVAASVP
jgi:hypothetical protein